MGVVTDPSLHVPCSTHQTIIGFGSLLSPTSALSSFPNMRNFRLARVSGYRRVFAHSPAFFFERNIARLETKEMASLSAEPCPGHTFIVSVFDIPHSEVPAFYEREDEFVIRPVRYEPLDGSQGGEGLMCIAWNDREYFAHREEQHMREDFMKWGLDRLWDWAPDSGLLPCRTYLRHCVLAASRHGDKVRQDFLDTTYLVDRRTTIADYLTAHMDIMNEMPPPSLAARENAAADGKQAASPEFRERAFKFAERKAVVVRRRSTVAAKEHVLEAKTFKTPTFCAHCSELLWGLYRQGLACTKCGRAVHRRCANALSVACAVPRLNHKEDIHPVPHQFQYETFMRPRTCKQCSTMVYGRGLRCARDTCQTIVHVACEKKATSQQQVESIIRLAQAKTDTVPPIVKFPPPPSPPPPPPPSPLHRPPYLTRTTKHTVSSPVTEALKHQHADSVPEVPEEAISGVTGGQAIDGRNGQPIVVDTFGNLDSQLSQLSLSQKAQRTSQRRASAPVPVMTDYRNIGIYGNPVRENGNQPSALLNTPPSRPPPVPPKSLGPNSVAPSTPEQLFSDRPRSTTNPPHPNFQTPPSPTSTLSTPALSVPARPPPPVPVDLSRRNTVSGIPSRPPPPIPVEIPEDPPEPLYMNMNPPKQSNLQSLQQNGPVASQRPQVSLADFYFDKVLGSGAFGKVMLAQYKPTGRAVAVKVLRKDVMLEAMGSEDIASELREKIVLESAHGCPYLCELFATFQTRERLFLVMGYYSGGRLLDLVLNLPQFPEAIAKFYTAELVLALGFLHERHIVYRDLKLENIMIDGQGHIKLIDFGLCKTDIDLLGSTHTFCGTLDYMAPEILAGHPYAYSVDWWALGVLLYELVCKQPPWESDEENEKMQEIQYAEILYPRTLAADTKAFLKALLTRDPLRRLGGWGGAYEVKQHAFYRGINWPLLERGALKPPFTPTQEICIDAHPNTALSPVPSTEEVFFENFDYTNPDFFQ